MCVMKNGFLVFAACLGFGLLAVSLPAPAHDVDGGPDCQRQYRDFGDAPEGVLAYPGVTGAFPTCTGIALPSTQTFVCPPISTPPGPSGFVMHLGSGTSNYWLGCYTDAAGLVLGVDGDLDGKMNQPAVGLSFCNQAPTDCVEAAFGLTFDQDECYADGSDAGVRKPVFVVCTSSAVTYTVFNCGPPRVIFLNILVDWNSDGDWNDNFQCGGVAGGGCAYEWAVKNVAVTLLPGCNILTSPAFLVGPRPGPGWMRVTICDEPVHDDFPWNGSVITTILQNGETEDYPVDIEIQTPTLPGSWGKVKAIYRG
jgi:hypothetical protein